MSMDVLFILICSSFSLSYKSQLVLFFFLSFPSHPSLVICTQCATQVELQVCTEPGRGQNMPKISRAIWAPGIKNMSTLNFFLGHIWFFQYLVHIRHWNKPTFSMVIWAFGLGLNISWALIKFWWQCGWGSALFWPLQPGCHYIRQLATIECQPQYSWNCPATLCIVTRLPEGEVLW